MQYSFTSPLKHVCTTAERIKNQVVDFVKNVDWKKVAIVAASSSVTNSLVRHGVDTVCEAVIDTISDASQGDHITPTSDWIRKNELIG